MNKRPTLWNWFFALAVAEVPYSALRYNTREIERHGLDVSFDALVAHHLAGGRIVSLVNGLVYARTHGIAMDFKQAATRDLVAAFGSRISLTEHLQTAERAGIRDMARAPLDLLRKESSRSQTRPDGGAPSAK